MIIFVIIGIGVIMNVNLGGEQAELLAQKGIFFPDYQTLVLADLHFGKINHFRKSGIPVPAKANSRNYETLIYLLNLYKPSRLLFLGDLFHSHYNEEWEVLGQIKNHFGGCSFELVIGNHDIMGEHQYQKYDLILHPTEFTLGKIVFTHETKEDVPDGYYNLSGHLHPGVRLMGSGKQSMMLPCFYFSRNHGILPAFGSFTGLAQINPKKEDRIFVIAEDKIIAYPYA
jgi:DNA ligase-associated metallophosphoesterase